MVEATQWVAQLVAQLAKGLLHSLPSLKDTPACPTGKQAYQASWAGDAGLLFGDVPVRATSQQVWCHAKDAGGPH